MHSFDLANNCESFLLPDYVGIHSFATRFRDIDWLSQPHNTRWLSPAQRRLAQVRLAEDAGEADVDVATDSYVSLHTFPCGFSPDPSCSAFSGLIMALKDPMVSIFAVMTCSQLLGLGFVNFFPTCVLSIFVPSMSVSRTDMLHQHRRYSRVLHDRHAACSCVRPTVIVPGGRLC